MVRGRRVNSTQASIRVEGKYLQLVDSHFYISKIGMNNVFIGNIYRSTYQYGDNIVDTVHNTKRNNIAVNNIPNENIVNPNNGGSVNIANENIVHANLGDVEMKKVRVRSPKPTSPKPPRPKRTKPDEYDDVEDINKEVTILGKIRACLPLNEKISLSNKNNVDMKADTKVQKKEVDASLNKYIKHLRLLNAIEQERSELVNTKIEDLINPNKNKEQQKIAILQPNPSAELLALYIVLSIPGVISSLTNKMKEQHIKKRKEEILQNSHVEAGKLYNYLMNKNVQGNLKKIHNFVKKEKHLNHLTGFNINPNHFKDEKNIQADKKNLEEQIEMKRHPFGHENSDPLIHDDNYYDAPVIPDYQNRPYGHKNDFKIDAHNLYSILRKKDKANLLNDREHYAIEGNDLFNILSKSLPINSKTQDVYKIDGHQLKSHLLQKAQNNEPIHELKESFDLFLIQLTVLSSVRHTSRTEEHYSF
ncbi:uncharacterized protein LOC108252813 [Diaphorina citri]|uniref:Uncharacterized protein LOC108252813 n=1 Tax=Diaphorina citri TaxID=121845 RepID=A0A1S4EFT9_DIACI|nr:uncharacterized protein LOC108252813 [Diaphorina citri]